MADYQRRPWMYQSLSHSEESIYSHTKWSELLVAVALPMFANLLINIKKLKSVVSCIFYFLSFVLLLLSFPLQNSKLWYLVRHACSTSPGSGTFFLCCPCLCLIKARATCKKKKKDSLFLLWGRSTATAISAALSARISSFKCLSRTLKHWLFYHWLTKTECGLASELCWVIRCQAYKVGSREDIKATLLFMSACHHSIKIMFLDSRISIPDSD